MHHILFNIIHNFMRHLNIAVFTTLEVRHNGELTSRTEFCNGDDLRITCSLTTLLHMYGQSLDQ